RRSVADGDLLADRVVELRPDALDLAEVFRASEWLLGPVLHDRLGLRRSDAGQTGQLGGRGRVDVDLAATHLRPGGRCHGPRAEEYEPAEEPHRRSPESPHANLLFSVGASAGAAWAGGIARCVPASPALDFHAFVFRRRRS